MWSSQSVVQRDPEAAGSGGIAFIATMKVPYEHGSCHIRSDPPRWWQSVEYRLSVKSIGITLVKCGGASAATWIAVKPPYDMPIMLTWPSHHSWEASHSTSWWPSRC